MMGLLSQALMIGTPSLPWMIHLPPVISSILSGMVAELICCAFVIGSCYNWKIHPALYPLIGFSLALVFRIFHVVKGIILSEMGAERNLFSLFNCVGRSDGSSSFRIDNSKINWYFSLLLWPGSYSDLSFPAESACKIMSKITSSDKPKSAVYSKKGRIGLGSFGMVALAEISLQVRVKKHGQGQSSTGSVGGIAAGNAGESIGGGGGDENGTIGQATGQGTRGGIGGGGQGRGNGDDNDNNGGPIVGNLGNGGRPRNPTPEEIATIFLPIIVQSIAIIMSLNDAELSTTGRVIRYFSMIINLVGFICCAAVLWQPYTNRRVARILNPRITGFLGRIGSALAVLGFISMMGVNLPLYPTLFMGLAFLVLLAVFLMDISEAIQ